MMAWGLMASPVDELTVVQPPLRLVRIEGSGTVKPFLIGKLEVTYRQFEPFVRETGYDGSAFPSSKPTETFLMDWKGRSYPAGKGDYPVCYLNWHHAKAYCKWLAKKSGRPVRLPTDAEWTLAAAGTQGRRYPWGDTWDPKRCNWGDEGRVDGYAASAPVGSFPAGATPEGALDMAGNVWEWSQEGHLRGGPWCMGPETVRTGLVANEITSRCDDKFGLRVCVPLSS